jgi:transposase
MWWVSGEPGARDPRIATWCRGVRCRICSVAPGGADCHTGSPVDEQLAVAALCSSQLHFHAQALALIDRELAVEGDDRVVRRLLAIPGIDVTAGLAILAAVGDFTRFASADKLVAYLGLHPIIRAVVIYVWMRSGRTGR